MKLYVGNLSYSVNDNTLRSIFEAYGAVESARVISDRDTGQSKGFGFVEMSDADGQKAMGALNGQELEGRALRVNEARPQEPRTGRRRRPWRLRRRRRLRPRPLLNAERLLRSSPPPSFCLTLRVTSSKFRRTC